MFHGFKLTLESPCLSITTIWKISSWPHSVGSWLHGWSDGAPAWPTSHRAEPKQSQSCRKTKQGFLPAPTRHLHIIIQISDTYLAWNALFVPRWSKSWHKQPTISARVSASVRTSWKLAVCTQQWRQSASDVGDSATTIFPLFCSFSPVLIKNSECISLFVCFSHL